MARRVQRIDLLVPVQGLEGVARLGPRAAIVDQQGGAQQFPGAFTPLSAKLIQEKGFPGVYISGGVLANELGLPDVGLTTLTEVAVRGGQILVRGADGAA